MFTLTCQTVSQSVMSLLHYFTTSLRLPSSGSVPLLMAESLRDTRVIFTVMDSKNYILYYN